MGRRLRPPSSRDGDGRTVGAVLVAFGLCVLPSLALARLASVVPPLALVGAWLAVVGGTFALLAWDKLAALRGKRRVPEAWLHLCELGGGWPATFLAQAWLDHKSAKTSYRLVLWGIVGAHQALALDALLGWRGLRALAALLA